MPAKKEEEAHLGEKRLAVEDRQHALVDVVFGEAGRLAVDRAGVLRQRCFLAEAAQVGLAAAGKVVAARGSQSNRSNLSPPVHGMVWHGLHGVAVAHHSGQPMKQPCEYQKDAWPLWHGSPGWVVLTQPVPFASGLHVSVPPSHPTSW